MSFAWMFCTRSVEQKRASDSYNCSVDPGNQILIPRKNKWQTILTTELSLPPSYPKA